MDENKTTAKAGIEIGGKKYPCRVTMGAMVRFKHESGKDVSKMDSKDMSELTLFIYCCVKSACNADGVPLDLDFETFADSLTPESVEAFNLIAADGQKKAMAAQEAAK